MADRLAKKTTAKGQGGHRTPAAVSAKSEVDAFLDAAKGIQPASHEGGRGRLLFALDATMSRQPTWDAACQIQAEMFEMAGAVGGLDVQLVYFRGFGECRASRWVADTDDLANLMSGISVRGGHTQIGKVLSHALKETGRQKLSAMIYVGDCVEESVDDLCEQAGRLGLQGVPAFVFQEGRDPHAAAAFKEIARLTGGAYCPFDPGAADQLRQLLSAVAVYAAGGQKALADYGRRKGGHAMRLIAQMKS